MLLAPERLVNRHLSHLHDILQTFPSRVYNKKSDLKEKNTITASLTVVLDIQGTLFESIQFRLSH